jgi:site-specific DNA-methyltransferase (adenine-specific)
MKLDTIYNTDCLEGMRQMDDNSVDLTVTSPPYDNLRTYKGYSFDFENIAKELYRVTKQGGVVVWVVGDATINGSETGTSFRQALFFKDIGFNLFDTMIYEKPPRGAIGSNQTYWQAFEYMFVFSKGKPNTINIIRDRKNKDSRKGDNGTKRLVDGTLQKRQRGGFDDYGRRTNIWQYYVGAGHSTKDEIAYKHPAIFPEALAADHIKTWSNEGDVVLDIFCGSGTTPKMARLLSRHYIGFEISAEYCEIIKQRLSQQVLF